MTWRSVLLMLCLWGVGSAPVFSQLLRPTFTDSVHRITAIAFSEDEQTLAVAYDGRPGVLLLDRAGGRPLRRLAGHNGPVRFLVFDDFNGQLLAAGDREATRWNLSDFQQQHTVRLSPPPDSEKDRAPARFGYDPSRQLLFRSKGSDLFCYSLRQNGLGKRFEVKEKNGAGERLSATLLAQAPDRNVLWALDIRRGILRRIELERFRQEKQLPVEGAIALAAGNERIAVLCEEENGGWLLRLFTPELQPLSSLPLEASWFSGPVRDVQFTGKGMISVAGAEVLVDIHLKTGAGRRRSIPHTYDRLFFGAGGELYLLDGRSLKTIGPRGRLQHQISLSPAPWLLHDETGGVVRLFDGRTLQDARGNRMFSVPDNEAPPLCADLRGGVLAVAYAGGDILLYDTGRRQLLRRLPAGRRTPGLLRVMPEHGRLLCMDGRGQELSLLDWSDGRLIRRWSDPEAPVVSVALQDSLLWVSRADGRLEQYDLPEGVKRSTIAPGDHPATAMAFAPGAEKLLLGSRTGIHLYHTTKFQPGPSIIGHDNAVSHMHFNRQGDRFLSIAHDGALKIWESATGRLLEHVDLKGQGAARAYFLDGGPDIAVLTLSGTLFYRPADIGIRSASIFPGGATERSGGQAARSAYNQDGSLLAVYHGDAAWLDVWETGSGTRLHRIPVAEEMNLNHFSFFDDRDILLLAGDCRFSYWDPRTGQLLKRVDYCLAGLQLAGLQKKAGVPELWAAQKNGSQLHVFDSRSGDWLRSLNIRRPGKDEPASLQGMDLSANGRHFALRDEDGVFIYDTGRERFRTHLPLPRRSAGEVRLSPDGSLLLFAAGAPSSYVVYDLFQEKVLFQFDGASAAFLDDRYLAVAHTGEPAIDIWDCYRGSPVSTAEAGQAPVQTLAAHPASQRLISSDARGRLLFWRRESHSFDARNTTLVQAFPLQPPRGEPNLLSLLFDGILPVGEPRQDPGI